MLPQDNFRPLESARATADAELEFEAGFDPDADQDN
jgi:hypothetical protein